MSFFKHIPNLLTIFNLLIGVLGIINVFDGNYQNTLYFIVIASIFDFFDGFTAKLFNNTSLFGKELDSLADMVTFGVLPGLFLYKWTFLMPDDLYWRTYSAAAIPIFAALRLAKFNCDSTQNDSFIGLPTPAAALLSVTIVEIPFLVSWFYFIPFYSLIVSLLLIAPIKMISFKFKSIILRGNELRYAIMLLMLTGLALFQRNFLPYVVPIYIIFSLLSNIPSIRKIMG